MIPYLDQIKVYPNINRSILAWGDTSLDEIF